MPLPVVGLVGDRLHPALRRAQHVDRVARKLKLITRKQTDWQTAVELTEKLRELDPTDPVKYDFALFGLGIEERWGGDAVLTGVIG